MHIISFVYRKDTRFAFRDTKELLVNYATQDSLGTPMTFPRDHLDRVLVAHAAATKPAANYQIVASYATANLDMVDMTALKVSE